MYRTTFLATIVFVLSLTGFGESQTLPLPTGQEVFQYAAVVEPVVSSVPAEARPIGVGFAAIGGDALELRIAAGGFEGAVDIYLAIASPQFDAGSLFIVTPDGLLEPVSRVGLVRWRENVSSGLNEALFGTIPISGLLPAEYEFFMAIAPSGRQDLFYIWHTTLVIEPSPSSGYFPFNRGNTWRYRVTGSVNGISAQALFMTSAITGIQKVAEKTAVVYGTKDPETPGKVSETYYLKDTGGITVLGTNDPADLVTQQIVPYLYLKFPLEEGSTFLQVERSGMNAGEDADGDGIHETVDIRTVVTVTGFETITIPAGAFTGAARVETVTTMSIHLSRMNMIVPANSRQIAWYALGVGPVKVTTAVDTLGVSVRGTEELVGYIINGVTHGDLP